METRGLCQLRWEPSRRNVHVEESLGASALHTEYYQSNENSHITAPPVT